ncbi:MAG: type IV pilus twitching motility protein PilT [Gemmatimonadota bacterium]
MSQDNPVVSEPPAGSAGGASGRGFKLRQALEEMVRRNASDLHLKVGRAPVLRIFGELVQLDMPIFRPDEARKCADQILLPALREDFAERHEVDFAIGVQGLGRFRVNLFQQRGTLSFAFRLIPFEIPSLHDLELPPILEDIAVYPRGLVLVTGITGSGKSTTLAAMVRYINEHRAVNIITIEDPIEFLHRDQRSLVSQREVGSDTLSFNEALRHVLRQDPDVIMLGEIRDHVSMDTCLKAANTGHLVLSTLHTTDAARSVSRIISFFPPHEHQEIRALLADALRAVVSMRLIPRADGHGRVPALEIMINTAAIAERIRSGDQLHTLPDLISEGRNQYGMQSFDQSLMELLRNGAISYETALHSATNQADFKLRASGIEAASSMSWDPGQKS